MLRKLKLSITLLGILGSYSIFAQSVDFFQIGATPQMDFYLSTKFVGHSYTSDGLSIFGVIVKSVDKYNGMATFTKEYVSQSDCAIGYGKLYAYTLDGQQLQPLDWVKGSRNVSSDIAETLCFIVAQQKN